MTTDELTEKIKKIIATSDHDAFSDLFSSNMETFATYRGKDGNILHLLANAKDGKFVSDVLAYYSLYEGMFGNGIVETLARSDKNDRDFTVGKSVIGNLLDEMDEYGRKPADIALARLKKQQSLGGGKDPSANKIVEIFKRYSLPHIDHTSHYYLAGKKYESGIPIEDIHSPEENKNGFTMRRPVFPEVVLLHLYNGLKPNESAELTPEPSLGQTTFFNYFERITSLQGTNIGEYTRTSAYDPTFGMPSQQLAKQSPFAQDFKEESLVADEIQKILKTVLADKNIAPIYQNFFKKGGLIAIENKGKRYLLSNSKGSDSKYYGVSTWINRGKKDAFPIVHLNVSAFIKDGNITTSKLLALVGDGNIATRKLQETLTHEIIHTADLEIKDKKFSDLPIFKYFLAVETGRGCRKTMEYDDPYRIKFAHIADHYIKTSFNREALANLVTMDDDDKDPLTQQIQKMFIAYVDARSHNDTAVMEIIEKAGEKLEDKEFLDKMYSCLEDELGKPGNEADYDYNKKYPERANEINTTIASRMLRDFKEINKKIAEIRKEPNLDEEIARDVYISNGYTDADFADIYDKTSSQIEGKSLKQLHTMLKKSMDNIDEVGKNPLNLYKMGIILTKINEEMDVDGVSDFLFFGGEKSYEQIWEKNRGEKRENIRALIGDARRAHMVLSALEGKKISKTSARIALDTGLKAENIEHAIQDIDRKMQDKTLEEARRDLEIVKTRMDSKDTIDPIDLIKTIRVAENYSSRIAKQELKVSLGKVDFKDLLNEGTYQEVYKKKIETILSASPKSTKLTGSKKYTSGSKAAQRVLYLTDKLHSGNHGQGRN